MTPFQILFSNGTVEATDPTGPPLGGGDPLFLGTRAFRRLTDLRGLAGTAERTRRLPALRFPFYVYVRQLFTVQLGMTREGWRLDEPNSSFPAPPGRQVEIYKGTLEVTVQSSFEFPLFGVRASTSVRRIDALVRIEFRASDVRAIGFLTSGDALLDGAQPGVAGIFELTLPVNLGAQTARLPIQRLTVPGSWAD